MNWFQEKLYPDHAQLLAVEEVLHEGRTSFQDVLIFRNPTFGKVLVLDDIVQLTEADNHIYHEMIAHVPLTAHGAAKRVLVIGGGDGGTLREVLKHPVESVHMVELDGEVIALARQHLPEISRGAFDDPRARVTIGDGARWVGEDGPAFDVIILDSTDPIGPGETLFSDDFYRDCRRRLRPGGIISVQSGATFYQPDKLDRLVGRLGACFGAARPFLAPVPTYAGGMLALVAAGESAEALCPPASLLKAHAQAHGAETRYYTPDVHHAAFVLAPSFASPKAGNDGGDVGKLAAVG